LLFRIGYFLYCYPKHLKGLKIISTQFILANKKRLSKKEIFLAKSLSRKAKMKFNYFQIAEFQIITHNTFCAFASLRDFLALCVIF